MREQKMRVAQVSFFIDPLRTPAEMLDAWSALTLTAEAAAGAGCDVHVVQAAREDERMQRQGVTYHFVAERAPSSLRRSAGRWASPITTRVIRHVADLGPDVVHVHGLSYPRHVAHLTESLPGIPVLLQDHADRPPPAWRVRSYRGTYRRVAGVMFTAAEQVQPFFATDALPPGPDVFEVIESTSRFTPGPQQPARASTGLHGDPCFLWVGRLDANKDPFTVLRAFTQAAPQLPDARLWMCYRDAPLFADVLARVQREPVLSARVEMLGPRSHSEVEQLLRAADFLVLASRREGSGYAVIEALACGTTPLVTDIPSFRRITGDGAVGALAPPGDADAMAHAMVACGRHDRVALRQAALDHFNRQLSLDAMGEQLLHAYRAATHKQRRAAAQEPGA